MSIPWRVTPLSVSPPSVVMADTDRKALRFNAGEPITTATVDVLSVGAQAADMTIVEATDADADGVTVTVSGLVRNQVYEMTVTFTRADGTRWTKMLALRCVA